MDCHPMFCSVYISLIVLTAGFVLTICSWLAPPLNSFVDNVRVIGIVSLAVGSAILSISCIVSALNHGRCCGICYRFSNSKPPFCLSEIIGNPLVNATAIVGSNLCRNIDEDPGVGVKEECDDVEGQANVYPPEYCSLSIQGTHNSDIINVKTIHKENKAKQTKTDVRCEIKNGSAERKSGYMLLSLDDPDLISSEHNDISNSK